MQRSTDRIRTTHVGSLARPAALLDDFPEYYEQYLKGAMTGGMAAPAGFTLQVDAPFLTDVFSHATSIVEHPDTIADRITRFAARRPGERGGQRRPRLLLPGHVYAGDRPVDRAGQVRGAGRGRTRRATARLWD